MQITVNLTAGQRTRLQVAGRYAAILAITGAASCELALRDGTATLEEVRTAARGLSLLSAAPFNTVELLAAATCTVELVISDGRVQLNTVEGATVNVTATAPLPVSNDRGAPGQPVYVAGITYSDAPATSMVDGAAVAVTAALTGLVAANVNRKALRLTNLHATNAVAVGGAGLTWAKRCIVLQPGDTWVEERGANLAWSAICDAGQTASVTAQEVLA